MDLLLVTHSPTQLSWRGGAVPAAVCCAKRLDWLVAARIVTHRRAGWVIDSFAPYKSSGRDGIFPALLQEGREVLIPYLVGDEQRKKPRPTFFMNVKLWPHSDMHIWAPFSWSQRTLRAQVCGHLELQ